MNTLRQALHEYLSHAPRNLGFKLREAGQSLVRFRHVHGAAGRALHHRGVGACLGATTGERSTGVLGTATELRTRICPLSQLPAIHARRFLSPGLLPFQPKRARPYLYSDEEIKRLLRAALEMPHRYERGALLPWVYSCLFGLLSVTGLRLGEARNLELQDVDLEAGVLTIRGAKFGKTRLVPLHASTCQVLAEYLARRQAHWAGRPVSSYLFVSSWGNRLDSGQIHRAFYVLSRQIGLRGASDRHGPRLHDLRHRFATSTLVNWYRADQDPERLSCPCCPPTSAMCTSLTHSGIWRALPS